MANDADDVEDVEDVETEQLVLGDLLNHVLDKGVVIGGTVTISIADIDLLMLDLRLLLTSVETAVRRGMDNSIGRLATGDPPAAGRGRNA